MSDREFASLQAQRDAAPRGRQKADLTRRVNNEIARRQAPAASKQPSLSPDMQRSWDRRERLTEQHRGQITKQTPDSMEARFINVKRADAFFDEMATRGFVVAWDKQDPTIVRVQRREQAYG